MSKGGAGKVYFVLYLAVILELLIIFIERDEAESNLRRQQRQAIEIVQTILSQLQTGSGATDISTNPKDQIVLDEDQPGGIERSYDVMVSVGDKNAWVVADGKRVRGDDIPLLEYNVSYSPNVNLDETDLGPDTSDIEGGTKIFEAHLGTEVGSYTEPRQILGGSIPTGDPTNYFTLNEERTAEMVAQGKKVKVFTVNFKPNNGAGWYRLRFNSHTNKILGIAGTGDPNPDDTIRIGNVNLTVKQLQQVQHALAKRRQRSEPPTEVENYITALLTPNAYKNFEQNRSQNSFNIRVIKPKPVAEHPVAQIIGVPDTVYWYTGADLRVQVKLGPAEAQKDMTGIQVDADKEHSLYTYRVPVTTAGEIPLVAKASNAGKFEEDKRVLMVEMPAMAGGTEKRAAIDKWKGLRAVVGRKFNPTSEWESNHIPESHYRTVVYIKGKEVLNKAGTTFRDGDLPDDLTVDGDWRPSDIVAEVFWTPLGTPSRDNWVLLAANQPPSNPLVGTTPKVPLQSKSLEITWPAPDVFDGFTHDAVITSKDQSWTLGPITIKQLVGSNQYGATSVTATCSECEDYGIGGLNMTKIDEFQWNLQARITDASKLRREIIGKTFDVQLTMTGQGGATGNNFVQFTVQAPKQ